MSISVAKNIFSLEELNFIKNAIDKNEHKNTHKIDKVLGRKFIGELEDFSTTKILEKMYKIAKKETDLPLRISGGVCYEYNKKYGKPNLPPHFDGDTNDLIINLQLSSNTTWEIGLNSKVYSIKDNCALVFNANKEIHWRTHKEFKDGEYVRMLFVRFYNTENISDYSHLNLLQHDDIFKETIKFRDSLSLKKS
jgi:hypothetical protein